MSGLFPYANVVTAILILLVGFGFHFVGQLISILNWDLVCRLGLQEANSPPDYYPLEHGTAVGDVLIGWVYGVAAIGLLLGADWGYMLAWIPGSILLYHSLCAWNWETDRARTLLIQDWSSFFGPQRRRTYTKADMPKALSSVSPSDL